MGAFAGYCTFHQTGEAMRVIGAGLFVFVGLLGLATLLGALRIFDHSPPWVAGLGLSIAMLVLAVASLWLFNPKGARPFDGRSAEEHLRELEQRGLLESTTFRATRAFGVAEFEDEGLHYFLELADGAVLFLSGQYLYDYEPIADDPDVNQPRTFPCSEFTVRRHRTEGYVADVLCTGDVLEPEVMAPPFGMGYWHAGDVPEDGRVIRDRTYDDLKRSRMKAAGEHIDTAGERPV